MSNIASSYLWPPCCQLAFYDEDGEFLWASQARDLDLSDSLMGPAGRDETVVVLLGMVSFSTSPRWSCWTERKLARIERLIRNDLCFDGDHAVIERQGEVGIPCSSEFRWRLEVSEE